MKKQRSIIFTILIGTIVILAGFTSRVWMASGTGNATIAPQISQGLPFTPSNPPRQDPKILGLLRRGALPFTLQQALQTMGNRLEVKGRERATVSGTLRSEGSSQEVAFTLVAELPKRLRLTLNNGSGNRVLIVDGQTIRSNNALSQRDYDIMETLIYDTTEHLLLEYDSGLLAMRYLGGHFRNSDNPAETPYDIFEASEVLSLGEFSRKQTKHYSFNSRTWLLERITYPRLVNNLELEVEVRMSNWQLIDGQKVATTIERFENKASAFRVTFNSVQYSAPLNDGIFQ
jgi:hypothetical protein